jgi:hypothetical protein
VLAVLVVRNLPGVLFADDWDLVGGTLIAKGAGELDLGHLLSQHNESRPLVPRLLFLAIGTVAPGGLRWLPLLSLVLAGLVSWCLFRLAEATLAARPARLVGLFVLANALVFTPKAAEAWLWSSYLGLLPIACLVGSLALLKVNRPAPGTVFAAAGLCSVATFSYANGLSTWLLAGAVVASVAGRRWLGVWLGGLVLNAGVYFHRYVRPASHPDLFEGLEPVRLGHFVLAFLGAPLGLNRLSLATAVGSLLTAVFVLLSAYWIAHSRDADLRRRLLPWLAIGGYSLVSGMAAGVGRSPFGVEHALANRYVPFSLYLGVSVLVAFPLVLHHASRRVSRGRAWRGIVGAASALGAAACIGLSVASTMIGAEELREASRALRRGKSCLLFIDVSPSERCLEQLYPDTSRLRWLARGLDRLGYLRPGLIESSRLQDIRPGEEPHRDVGVFERVSEKQGRFVVEGWAGRPVGAGAADAVIVAIEEPGGTWVPLEFAAVSLPRPDVARARGRAYSRSGWRVDVVKQTLRARRRQPVRIGAWAFDATSSRALPLEGVFTLDAVGGG